MLVNTLLNILQTNNQDLLDLRYCLVDKNKLPYTINGVLARSNHSEDFVNFNQLVDAMDSLETDSYKGVGASIQASNICAIDVDHCFKEPFDINSGDERAHSLIEMFKTKAYIEFSFSGTGLRILFKSNVIDNYSEKYYIKNKNNSIEFYQPNNSYRYVTITGKYIYNNGINALLDETLLIFLDKYMKKTVRVRVALETDEIETRSYDDLMKKVKCRLLKDYNFQDLWFTKAPGSGKDESERDYHLISYLYENITRDQSLIKQIFESSEFFKTKDRKHVNKWVNQDYRYFNYLYDVIRRSY